MKKTIIFYLILLITIASGCSKVDLGEEFSTKVGYPIRVNSTLSFSIDSIYDYRCPVQVMCIWPGDVKLFITYHRPFSKIDTALYLNDQHKNPIDFGNYEFRFLGIKPENNIDKIVPQDDYLIRLIVQKK